MKVAILTFSKAPNYGALLQTYALTRLLESKGHDVTLVCSELVDQIGWKYRIRFLSVMHKFVAFQRKYLPAFAGVHYDPSIDLYIVGSDQVWNPDLSVKPLDYFFNFLPQTAKRISYAASFGTDTWENDNITFDVKKNLEKFQAISVREFSGVQICKAIFGVKADWVLDPTFLLDNYFELTGKVSATDIMISFQLTNHPEWNMAEDFLSKELGLNLKSLNAKKAISFLPSLRGFNRNYVSVSTWVKSIAESKFVLTDSFHAMVFAIIYRKQFVVLPSVKNRMGRVTSLLSQLGLRDRYYDSISELLCSNQWRETIDYSETEKKINQLKEESIAFLNKYLCV